MPSESVDHHESGPTRDRHQACPGGTTLDGGFKKRFEEQKEKNASSETTPFMCSIRTRKTKTGTLQQAAPPPPPFLRCPSELIVGITLGKLNCLQPCVQLYFTHMEWHLHILSFRNELIINQLFLN